MNDVYFKKLEFKLEDIDYSRIKGEFFEGYGDSFKQYCIKDVEYLEKIIGDKLQFSILPDHKLYCEITDYGAGPHTDHSSVALNYYLDSANYVTIFWKEKLGTVGNMFPQTQKDGSLKSNTVRAYQFSELLPAANFKAEIGDAYLLDIKKIHSATKLKSENKTRKILRWLWNDYDFETIEKSINILDKNCQ